MQSEPKCNRCGKCCYYVLNGIKKKCKYLALERAGKSFYRIYHKRLGTEIDKGIYCNRIEDVIAAGAQFEGCPFNVLLKIDDKT